MANMKSSLVTDSDADILVLMTFRAPDKDLAEFSAYDKQLGGLLADLKKRKEFEGNRREVKILATDGPALALVGLGDREGFKKSALPRVQEAVRSALWTARDQGFKRIALLLQKIPGLDEQLLVARLTEFGLLSARVFHAYRKESLKEVRKLDELQIVVEKKSAAFSQAFTRAVTLSGVVNRVRDLQDTPANDLYPDSFAKHAAKLARELKLTCKILDEKELKRLGHNAILAVGKGSVRKPRIVAVTYKPKGQAGRSGRSGRSGQSKKAKHVAVVGKGITFDTGGYNLKPTGFMEAMKSDMSGAAIALGVVEAAARLKLKTAVTAVLCLAENMVSGDSYRPSDVIETAGFTIEVGNTDAEGRLALADGLAFAAGKKPAPDAIVDVATLTGACVVTFGELCAAIMGSDEKLLKALRIAGDATAERCWELPLWEEYEDDLKGKVADLKNMGYKRQAGTITAGQFLKQFTKELPWAHVDVAGTAFVERPGHCSEHGGTGFGVRLILEAIEKYFTPSSLNSR